MEEQPSQDEIELRMVLETFFAKVAEMSMIEQMRILTDFQDFLAESREEKRREAQKEIERAMNTCE